MIRCRFHLLRLKLETYEAKGMALTSRKSLVPACNLLNWKGILFNGMELAYLTPAAIAIRLLARRVSRAPIGSPLSYGRRSLWGP